MYVLKTIILFIFLMLLSLKAHTQQILDPKFESIFIYQICQYVDWGKSPEDFVIGVLGKTDIVDELNNMAEEKKIGAKKIKIITFNSVDEITSCNLLFITHKQAGLVGQALNKLKNKKVLIIGENPGLIQEGVGINFIYKDGRLRFEMCKRNCAEYGITTLKSLDKLAILIN